MAVLRGGDDMSLDSYVHLADDAINQTFADEVAPKPRACEQRCDEVSAAVRRREVGKGRGSPTKIKELRLLGTVEKAPNTASHTFFNGCPKNYFAFHRPQHFIQCFRERAHFISEPSSLSRFQLA